MIKLITIVGARPQFIKASAISRAIKTNYYNHISETLVHTGQHYDDNMSAVFFDELQLPLPKYNLNTGSGSHGKQTSEMMSGIESVLLSEKPDAVVIYGDTNSTLAAAVAAAKLHIAVVHIEAGLRSFNKLMPEEINRICTDHVSTLLFSPSLKGIENLMLEGFATGKQPPYGINKPGVFHCGDIMYDNSLYFSKIAEHKSHIIEQLDVEPDNYVLVTLHRDTNTDDAQRLNSILSALQRISLAHNMQMVIPLHPRTQKKWEELSSDGLKDAMMKNKLIRMIPAASYLDFIRLEKNARLIMTDSGGVQKEAYFFEKKCVILRDETEWVELLDLGIAQLCGADEERIVKGFDALLQKQELHYPPIYGDGHAAEFILDRIIETFR